VPVAAGTITWKTLSAPTHMSGNDACPDACGCDTATTAWTTVHRSGHEAMTWNDTDPPSGASQATDWMSTVGGAGGRACAGVASPAARSPIALPKTNVRAIRREILRRIMTTSWSSEACSLRQEVPRRSTIGSPGFQKAGWVQRFVQIVAREDMMLRKVLWTGLYAGLGAVATVAARRTASKIWRVGTGEEPPSKR